MKTTEIPASRVNPGDVLVIAGRFRMNVIGVKANDYGVEDGVTLYLNGSDGQTAIYRYDAAQIVNVLA